MTIERPAWWEVAESMALHEPWRYVGPGVLLYCEKPPACHRVYGSPKHPDMQRRWVISKRNDMHETMPKVVYEKDLACFLPMLDDPPTFGVLWDRLNSTPFGPIFGLQWLSPVWEVSGPFGNITGEIPGEAVGKYLLEVWEFH